MRSVEREADLEREQWHARMVIARIRDALGVRSDREIGPLVGRGESVAGNWALRGSVPREIIERVSALTGRSSHWLRDGDGVCEDSQPYPGVAASDPRLDAIVQWWRDWWATASEDEKVWALVQLRRAFPESAEAIRRHLQGRSD